LALALVLKAKIQVLGLGLGIRVLGLDLGLEAQVLVNITAWHPGFYCNRRILRTINSPTNIDNSTEKNELNWKLMKKEPDRKRQKQDQ